MDKNTTNHTVRLPDTLTMTLESLAPQIGAIVDPTAKVIIHQLLLIITEQQTRYQKIIEEQNQIIAAQRLKIEELEEKLKDNSNNSSKPPSSDMFKRDKVKKKPKTKGKKRKQGGQPGHVGKAREYLPLESVDKVEKVLPNKACSCGGPLTPTTGYKRHQVYDLPLVKPIVTEWQLYGGYCYECGKTCFAELPAGIPRGLLGSRLLAMVGTLTGAYRMSKRNVMHLLTDFFGMRISLGTVSNAEKVVSAALKKPVKEAKDFIPEQPIVHADETSFAQKGKKMWTWTFIGNLVTTFIIHPSRGAKVAKGFLGEAFQGILNTDRFSAYIWLAACFRQVCWAHLIRDFRKISERRGKSKRIGTDLLESAHEMFRSWHKVRDGTLPREQFQTLMKPLRENVERLLEEGTRVNNAKTKGTCKQILKIKQALWTFVDHVDVEPTNNLAEQTLRRIVIWRKTSFGTQSPRGTRYLERIMTVVATCNLQQRNVLDFLSEAIQAHLSGMQLPSLLPLEENDTSLAIAA